MANGAKSSANRPLADLVALLGQRSSIPAGEAQLPEGTEPAACVKRPDGGEPQSQWPTTTFAELLIACIGYHSHQSVTLLLTWVKDDDKEEGELDA